MFNHGHNFVGTSAMILAMTAILLATTLAPAKLNSENTLPIGELQSMEFFRLTRAFYEIRSLAL